ncbi:MAG: type I-E CRISPR-associated protein Cse1/CasA [Treponema sp.]|jgi:CRISPR system Cascade subunit CasA|nr:type I-E CRISPR-associated protein Cse1/CasA [Treponema sp.]
MSKQKESENRYNLLDEAWIPVAGKGKVGLLGIFQNPKLQSLGGNAIQKLALFKLLLAICQSAYTPVDEEDWESLGAEGLSKKAAEYLQENRELFWLYGKKPFLQMPSIKEKILARKKQELAGGIKEPAAEANAKPKQIGLGYYPDMPADNNTVLNQNQIPRIVSDAEKALFIVTLMNFAFGGKRIEKKTEPFTPGYSGKTVSARSGPSIGNHWGYLHTFITGDSIINTLWLNLFTKEYIENEPRWEFKKKVAPPWEKMPKGEDCERAKQIKKSYMGCLVGMCRFVLLEGDGIYYLEGIQYPSHKQGWWEPSMCINDSEGKLLWADPDKKPWRELTSLLAFIGTEGRSKFNCSQVQFVINRIRNMKMKIGIWSGGIRVHPGSGDQSIKQDDDFVESETFVIANQLEPGFYLMEQALTKLEKWSRYLSKIVYLYCRELKIDAKPYTKAALASYWQFCNVKYQELIDSYINEDKENAKKIEGFFFRCVQKCYDRCCPHDTATRRMAWAMYSPTEKNFYAKEEKEEDSNTEQTRNEKGEINYDGE